MFDLRYYQRELCEAARRAWESHQSTAIIAATGTGKCLGEGTPVLLFDGTVKPVEGVAVGDLLMGPDSRPRRVLSLARGRERLYRVVPTKGDPYVVNESHVLSLKLTPARAGGGHALVNVTVRDYLSRSATFKHRAKGWRAAVDWPEREVPLDPYLLGLWLGDGLTRRPAISKPDPEVAAAVRGFADAYGLRVVRAEAREGACPTLALSGTPQRWRPNPVYQRLRDLGVVGDRHVPLAYKANSRGVRLGVLAGLLDSDGHQTGGGFDYVSKDRRLALDVAFLCRSLGLAAYVGECEKGCQGGFRGRYWRVSISGDCSVVPTRIRRKQAPPRRQVKDVLVTGIAVEPAGVGDYYGFTLDGDGLFLLGDFTVTHNTECYLSLAVSEPGRVLVLVHRDYLIRQPVARLAAAGFDDVAVEKADERAEGGLRKAKVVFASVQSVGPAARARRLAAFDPREFSLVVVDEGHRATAATYRRVLGHFRRNPRLKVLVLTATPRRKDGVALGNVCDSVAGVYGPSRAMDEGWIVPVRFFRRDVKSLDFSNVRLKGTDLDPEQVQALLMEERPLHEVCASLAEDRGPTIVFCPEVAVARAYEQLMNGRYRPGRARMLYADSPDDEREEAGKRLAQGEIDYIFNVNLYTEGFDLPDLLRVVWAAPTASLVRYTQGVGRVFRPHPGLRGHLAGGREDAAARRLLIAQSPKPFGVVVTYYPQNCAHELCDPVDVLGGDDLPPDVRAAAKQVQDETARLGGGSSAEEDIETARAFCELRGVLEARRKGLKARAEFADREFDPMSGRRAAAGRLDPRAAREAAARATADWPAGEPATDRQLGWFRWKRVAVPEGLTKFRACVVRDLIELGVRPETALSYGKRQALCVRDDMRARGAGVGAADAGAGV